MSTWSLKRVGRGTVVSLRMRTPERRAPAHREVEVVPLRPQRAMYVAALRREGAGAFVGGGRARGWEWSDQAGCARRRMGCRQPLLAAALQPWTPGRCPSWEGWWVLVLALEVGGGGGGRSDHAGCARRRMGCGRRPLAAALPPWTPGRCRSWGERRELVLAFEGLQRGGGSGPTRRGVLAGGWGAGGVRSRRRCRRGRQGATGGVHARAAHDKRGRWQPCYCRGTRRPGVPPRRCRAPRRGSPVGLAVIRGQSRKSDSLETSPINRFD